MDNNQKRDDDLMSFLSSIPGAEFVNISKDGGFSMDGPKYEKLRQRHEYGASLFKKGQYVEAIRCFKEVIDGGFEDPKAYLNIGVCYGTMGQWSESLKWLRLAHSKFPNDDQITQNLATAEQSAGESKKMNHAIIKLRCPNVRCGKKLSVPEQHAGKKGKCPACGQVVVVPAKPQTPQAENAKVQNVNPPAAKQARQECPDSGGDTVTIPGDEWAGGLWADNPVRVPNTLDVAAFMRQSSLPPVWPEDDGYKSYVANDQQQLQNHWITVLLHHPNSDVVMQTLRLPHIECVGPIPVAIADILVQRDQALTREAAKTVWRLTDYGVKKIFNVILSRGIMPSDYSRSQVNQAVDLLKDECPAEKKGLLEKELHSEK